MSHTKNVFSTRATMVLGIAGAIGLQGMLFTPVDAYAGTGSTATQTAFNNKVLREHQVKIAAVGSQPEGSPLALTVGLTPGGDGSTCGSATNVVVNVGDEIDFCYTVTNNSATAMAYSTLDDSIDGNIFAMQPTAIPASGGTYVYHRTVTATASHTYAATWTARDVLPGYTSNDTVPAAFVDITATGTGLNLTDDGSAAITSPFAFSFYGVPSTQFCVGNNGVLVFGVSTCTVAFSNVALPGTFGGAAIAPFWDDMFQPSGNVYWAVQGSAPNRTLIVEWDRAHYNSGAETSDRAQFEVILGENGSLSFQYQDLLFGTPNTFDNGISATIGLQGAGGSPVNQYSFNTVLPHPAPSSIVWTLTSATILTASANVSLDVGAPVIGVTPATISASAAVGGAPVNTPISIANTGDRILNWDITEGSAPTAVPNARTGTISQSRASIPVVTGEALDTLLAQRKLDASNGNPVAVQAFARDGALTPASNILPAGADCGPSVQGIVIHDDSTAENGYSGNVTTVSSFIAVDKFTPDAYPTSFTTACVALISNNGSTSIDYDVVVFDDDGAGGAPGTELGAVTLTGVVNAIGGVPASNLTFNAVDISALGVNVASGSVYIGVRYNAIAMPGRYVAADQSGTPDVGGGYASYDTGSGPSFVTLASSYPTYHSLFVRAVAAVGGCALPADAPWLSVAPGSGSVAVGGSPSTPTVTMDPTGLSDGLYEATVCVNSNDSAHPTVSVPVSFTVGDVDPTATVTPGSFTFALETGDTDAGALSIANSGDVGSNLTYTITEAVGDCGTPSDVPWLSESPVNGSVPTTTPASVTVAVDTTSLALGAYSANICIATNDSTQAMIAIPVTLNVNPPDLIFEDGFDGTAGPATYTDRTEFLTHVAAGYYENGFDDAVPGASPPLNYSSGGWAYTVDAASDQLYNDTGLISTNLASDQIVVTFTGDPVTAVGGNFWGSDINVAANGSDLTVSLSDGTTETYASTGPTDFRGFTTAGPVTSLTLDASDDVANSWPTLDNLIVGASQ